ncbi:MAG: hypothetical protein AAF557_11285 [Pseudomonadota bacterium]
MRPEINRRILPQSGGKSGLRTSASKEIFVFLDDLHVIDRAIQSQVLDILYAITRGNQVFLKISAIENLTRTFDPTERVRMELPLDAQAPGES